MAAFLKSVAWLLLLTCFMVASALIPDLFHIPPVAKALIVAAVFIALELGNRIVQRMAGRDLFDMAVVGVLRWIAWKRIQSVERAANYLAPYLTKDETRWLLENALEGHFSIAGREVSGRFSFEGQDYYLHATMDPPREDSEIPEEIDEPHKTVREITVRLIYSNPTARELPARLTDLTALLDRVSRAFQDKRHIERTEGDRAAIHVRGWQGDVQELKAELASIRRSSENVEFGFLPTEIHAAGTLSAAVYSDMQSMVLMRARWRGKMAAPTPPAQSG